MKVQYSNNAATTLGSSVEIGHEVLVVASASAFPILSGGDWMYVTVEEEVVKVTATSGNLFTCEAFNHAHGVGASVQGRITTKVMEDSGDADFFDSVGVAPPNGSLRVGEMYFNAKDLQFGAGDSVGTPNNLIAVRYHSVNSGYIIGDLVAKNGDVWKALLTHSGVWSESNWMPLGTERYIDLGGMSGVVEVDVSTGEAFKLVISTTTVISFIGFESGKHKTIILDIVNAGSDVTWDSIVAWPEGTAPELSVTGRDKLIFSSVDGGLIVDGGLCGVGYAQ